MKNIKITGATEKGSNELRAAEALKSKIAQAWKELLEQDLAQVKIIVEPQWEVGRRKECDLMIIGDFKTPMVFEITENLRSYFKSHKRDNRTGKKYLDREESENIIIQNFIFLVECKNIDQEQIKIHYGDVKIKDGSNYTRKDLTVKYPNKKFHSNITSQIEESKWGFEKHVERYINRNFNNSSMRNPAMPMATKGVFLQSMNRDVDVSHVFNASTGWSYIFNNILLQLFRFQHPKNKTKYRDEVRDIYCSYEKEDSSFYYDAEFLPSYEPSKLDQKHMDAIAKKIRKDAKWPPYVGKKLIMLIGSGGTGKTIRLLQLAWNKYEYEFSSILVLTYNIALVSNLTRIAHRLGIKKLGSKGDGIVIQSVQSYIWHVLKYFGMLSNEDIKDYLNIQEDKIKELADKIRDGTINIKDLRENDSFFSRYDYAFIDEGQDWPKDEAYVINSIFAHNNLVIAHGINQETRGTAFDWRQLLPVNEDKKETTLTTRSYKARRMKSNLLYFTQAISKDFLLNDSYSEMEDIESGGSVYIVVGDNLYKNKELLDKFINERKVGIESNIDLLHCVPSQDLFFNSETGEKQSHIAKKFGDFGYSLWDASGRKTRATIPDHLDVMRFVNYQSSRGLEGWSVFCHGFDDFWNEMLKKGAEAFDLASTQTDLFKSQFQSKNEFIQDYAAKWACIATTRAVDSLVIQINDKNSQIGKKLFDLSKKDDSIYWLE